MKKAIVTLVKRLSINNLTSDGILREIFDNSYSEIGNALQNYQMKNYSLYVNGRNTQLKTAVDSVALMGSMNSIFKLNRFIPELWDASHRINLKILMETGKLPSVRVEVIEFISGEKEKLQLAVYFETEHLILLDSINNKLLLSYPNTNGEEDANHTYFTDTFFLHLTDELYFSDYKLIEK